MSHTILVVDDNPELLETTVLMFQNFGYQVLQALNATAALDLLTANDIDILFTDFVMPGKVRSVDLANAVKKKHPGAIIIFASGYSVIDKDLIGDAITVGKPYSVQDVHAMILEQIKDLQGN